jgi:hypothetical protein
MSLEPRLSKSRIPLLTLVPALGLTVAIYALKGAWPSAIYFPVIWAALSIGVELLLVRKRGGGLQFVVPFWALALSCLFFFAFWVVSQGHAS